MKPDTTPRHTNLYFVTNFIIRQTKLFQDIQKIKRISHELRKKYFSCITYCVVKLISGIMRLGKRIINKH